MQDRAALILSVALATLGWLLTHYVDRVTQSPTVEYSISETHCVTQGKAPTTCDYRYRIANLSRTAMFGPIRFDFVNENGNIEALWVEPKEPAHEGDSPPQIVRTTAIFQLAALMPGARVTIVVRAKGPRPTMSVRAAQPIRMSPPTFETRLARFEMWIMLVLIVIWSAVIAYLMSKKPAPPALPGPDPLHRHLVSFTAPGEAPAPRT